MPSSNFLVWVLHTGVSRDGTTLNSRAFFGVSARVTAPSPLLRARKSGALSPGLTFDPTSVTGPPLNVTSLVRFSILGSSWWGSERGGRQFGLNSGGNWRSPDDSSC